MFCLISGILCVGFASSVQVKSVCFWVKPEAGNSTRGALGHIPLWHVCRHYWTCAFFWKPLGMLGSICSLPRCHFPPYFSDKRLWYFLMLSIASDHLLHWETRQFFGPRRWLLIKWMNQSSSFLSVFGSRVGMWHNSGAWGPAAGCGTLGKVSYLSDRPPRKACSPFLSRCSDSMCRCDTCSHHLSHHEGRQSKGKVSVLMGVFSQREKNLCRSSYYELLS